MKNTLHRRSILATLITIASVFTGCTPEEQDAFEKYCEGRNCGIDGDQPNSNSDVIATYAAQGYAPCCQCDDGRTGNSCQTYMYNQFFRKDYTIGTTQVSTIRIDPVPTTPGDPNIVNFLIKVTTPHGTLEISGNLLKRSEYSSIYGEFPEFAFIKDLYIPVIAIPEQTVSGFTVGGSFNFISITDTQYHQFQKTAMGLDSEGERPTTAYFSLYFTGTEAISLIGTFDRVM